MVTGCEATRAAVKPKGWDCTGEDLVMTMTMNNGALPIVVPRCLFRYLMTEFSDIGAGDLLNPQPFTGGDHAHHPMPWAEAYP